MYPALPSEDQFKFYFGVRGHPPGQLQCSQVWQWTPGETFLWQTIPLGQHPFPWGQVQDQDWSVKSLGPQKSEPRPGWTYCGWQVNVSSPFSPMTGWLAILGDLGPLRAGPHFVVVNDKNEIVVTDLHNHSLKMYSANRVPLQVYGKGNGQLWPPVGTCSLSGQQWHIGIQELWLLPVLYQHIYRALGPGTDLGWPHDGGQCWELLLRPMLSPVTAQGPCLTHRGTDLEWLDKRVWPEGEPDMASLHVGCGHWYTGVFLFSISQTQVATYFILALVTGWSWTVVPRIWTELPIIHLLSTQSAPYTQTWSQDSLLLQGKSPSGFSGKINVLTQKKNQMQDNIYFKSAFRI